MRLSIMLAVAFAFGLQFATSAPVSAQSYPLTCRIVPMNGLLFKTERSYITFVRGSGLASSGVQPGTCAWLDRAFRPAEANELCFPSPTFTQIVFSGATVTSGELFLSGPAAALVTAAILGPPTVMNFSVHAIQLPGGSCLNIDTFGV
jgi:hypothetical protein